MKYYVYYILMTFTFSFFNSDKRDVKLKCRIEYFDNKQDANDFYEIIKNSNNKKIDFVILDSIN